MHTIKPQNEMGDLLRIAACVVDEGQVLALLRHKKELDQMRKQDRGNAQGDREPCMADKERIQPPLTTRTLPDVHD